MCSSMRRAGVAACLFAHLSLGAACSRTSSEPAHAAEAAPTAVAKVVVATPAADTKAERKTKGKWKDAGVYVDGRWVGVLWFGELPRSLEPVWIETVEALDFKPGDNGPRERVSQERRFRFAEYLTSVGVDAGRVKAVHVRGGGGHTAEISAPVWRKYGDRIYFGFGRDTAGKAIPYFPAGMPVNTNFDRVAAVSFYIDKPAPTINDEEMAELDGAVVEGIPYFGAPVRGGIRIYKDDVLEVAVKRQDLEELRVRPTERDGALWYPLVATLYELGVDTDDVVDGELIVQERRAKILDATSLAERSFSPGAGKKGGGVKLDDGTVIQAIALYSSDLPGPPPSLDPPAARTAKNAKNAKQPE